MEIVPITEGEGEAALAAPFAAGDETGDDMAVAGSAGFAAFELGLGSGGVFSHAARAARKETRAAQVTKERGFIEGAG